MSNFRTLDDLRDVRGKVALVRVDLNLPMQDGAVTDATRIRAAMPTILELADAGAKVLLLAHFGRPKGARHSEMSLSMVVGAVQDVLGREVAHELLTGRPRILRRMPGVTDLSVAVPLKDPIPQLAALGIGLSAF